MGQTSGAEIAEVLRQEREELGRRRDAANLQSSGGAVPDKVTGLALSGGGIRSASLALGFLQTLYRRGILRHIDYLSTVSGGGYAGSWLSSLILAQSSAIDWRDRDTAERHPRPEQSRLPLDSASGGRQSAAVQNVARAGESLRRPLQAASSWFWGFIVVNAFLLSGILAACSFAAWLFRLLYTRDSLIWLQQLGFPSDASRPFFPAFVLLCLWLAAQLVRSALRRRYAHVPAFPTVIFTLFIASVVMGLLTLFAIGDISMYQLDRVWKAPPEKTQKVGDIVGWIGNVIIALLVAALLPLLRPAALLRSGTRPKNVTEKWFFKLISYSAIFGVPAIVFWVLVREDVSASYQSRTDRYTFAEPQIETSQMKGFWNEVAKRATISPQESGRDPATAVATAISTVQRNLRSVLVRLQGGAPRSPDISNLPMSDRLLSVANNISPPGSSSSWVRYRASSGMTSQGPPMRLPIDEFLTLLDQIDLRDKNAWPLQRCWQAAMHDEQFQDELGDRRRWWDWRRRISEEITRLCLSDPSFHHCMRLTSGAESRKPSGSDQATEGLRSPAPTDSPTFPDWYGKDADLAIVLRDADKLERQAEAEITRIAARQFAAWSFKNQPVLSYTELKGQPDRLFRLYDALRNKFEELRSLQHSVDRLDEEQFQAEFTTCQSDMEQLERLLLDVRRTNFALIQAHFPGNAIRNPDTVFALVCNQADQSLRLYVACVSSLICLMVGLLIPLNPTTLHGFYRNRLASMWIIEHPELGRRIPLSKLDTTGRGGPYHLINGALNLFGRRQDREKDATARFTFARTHCGSGRVGYRETALYDRGQSDLANAMAVSGAALSPSQIDNPLVRIILSLLNLRLGQWLPNPANPPSDISWPTPLRLLTGYLLWKPEERPYCFVSDGGHDENTGIGALLQRRCRVVIACDASQDEGFRFQDLNRLIGQATSRYGVQIKACSDAEVDFTPLIAPAEPKPPLSRSHYVLMRLIYPDDRLSRLAGMHAAADRTGYLVYVKPTLTGDEPLPVREHRKSNDNFPFDPTLDQFFEAERFEAYRALGEHLGDTICRELFEGRHSPDQNKPWLAEDWKPFEDLAANALHTIPLTTATAPVVFRLLHHRDETIRGAACGYLHEQADSAPEELRPVVLRELQQAFGATRDAQTRILICNALQQYGPDDAGVRAFLKLHANKADELDEVRLVCQELIDSTAGREDAAADLKPPSGTTSMNDRRDPGTSPPESFVD